LAEFLDLDELKIGRKIHEKLKTNQIDSKRKLTGNFGGERPVTILEEGEDESNEISDVKAL
jgi:hypothetical protein